MSRIVNTPWRMGGMPSKQLPPLGSELDPARGWMIRGTYWFHGISECPWLIGYSWELYYQSYWRLPKLFRRLPKVTHSTGTVFNQLIEWDGIGVFYIGSAGYMNYREVQNHGDIYRIWLAKGHDTLWWIQQLRAVDVTLQHVDKSG